LLYIVQFQNPLLVLLQWGWLYLTCDRSARLITGKSPLSLDLQARGAAHRRDARAWNEQNWPHWWPFREENSFARMILRAHFRMAPEKRAGGEGAGRAGTRPDAPDVAT